MKKKLGLFLATVAIAASVHAKPMTCSGTCGGSKADCYVKDTFCICSCP